MVDAGETLVVNTVCPAAGVIVANAAPFNVVANSTLPFMLTAFGKVAVNVPDVLGQTLLMFEVIDEGATLW